MKKEKERNDDRNRHNEAINEPQIYTTSTHF
jgi:hypothetical protein